MQITTTTEIQRYAGTHKARAEAWAAHSDADLKRRAVVAAHERAAAELWSLTEAYLTLHGASGATVSPHTRRSYRRGVEDLVAAWARENLLRPSRDAAHVFVRDLEAQGLTPGTVRVKLASARLLYKALRWAGATEAVPFEDVRAARDHTAPEDKRRPYTHEALERLLQAAGPVDRVMVLLGAHSGLRVAEMVALEWRDVDLAERTMTVRRGKGGKRRAVTLGPTVLQALNDLRAVSLGAKVLPFATTNRARQRLEALCNRAGVRYLGVHALRHYSGTRLAGERELRDVARHLGHSSIETTAVYAKWRREALQSSVGTW